MRKNYIYIILILLLWITHKLEAQIKIVKVNPLTESITIKNFGTSKVNITNYRLCSRFSYGSLSQMTVVSGSLDLEANDEVIVTSSVDLNNTSADLGLYLDSGSFGLASSMVDFVQWGAAGIGRESVANTAGLWTAGTFIATTVTPPYVYVGNGVDNGSSQWVSSSSLSVNDFDTIEFSVYPNPATNYMKIQLPLNIAKAKVEVYSLTGRSVVLKKELQNDNSLNLESLETGVYFIKVLANGKQGILKFVKQ